MSFFVIRFVCAHDWRHSSNEYAIEPARSILLPVKSWLQPTLNPQLCGPNVIIWRPLVATAAQSKSRTPLVGTVIIEAVVLDGDVAVVEGGTVLVSGSITVVEAPSDGLDAELVLDSQSLSETAGAI